MRTVAKKIIRGVAMAIPPFQSTARSASPGRRSSYAIWQRRGLIWFAVGNLRLPYPLVLRRFANCRRMLSDTGLKSADLRGGYRGIPVLD
jgi:hypothetical protein